MGGRDPSMAGATVAGSAVSGTMISSACVVSGAMAVLAVTTRVPGSTVPSLRVRLRFRTPLERPMRRAR